MSAANRGTRSGAGWAVGLIVSIVIGLVIGSGHLGQGDAKTLGDLAVIAIAGLCAWARITQATIIVGLAAGACNALPSVTVTGAKFIYIGVVLCGYLAWLGRSNFRRVPKAVLVTSAALFVWWLTSTLRGIAVGAPAFQTFRFGADFGLFALLLPAYTAALLNDRLRRQLLVGFGILVLWVATVNVLAGIGAIAGAGFFSHAYRVTPSGGIFRLYTLSSEIPAAAIPFLVSLTITANRRVVRVGAFALLSLCLVEMLLDLGRAQYAGIALAIILLIVVLFVRYPGRVVGLCVATAFLVATATAVGPLQRPLNEVVLRSSSIFSNSAEQAVDTQGSTLALRNQEERSIRASMTTSDWVVGRGFLPSPWYTFKPDQTGSLRNSDLGWYNALNTMGLAGVVLVFAPVAIAICMCLRAGWLRSRDSWLPLGAAMFGIYAVAVSPTLVTLFSAYGLSVASAALGMGLAAALRGKTAKSPAAELATDPPPLRHVISALPPSR